MQSRYSEIAHTHLDVMSKRLHIIFSTLNSLHEIYCRIKRGNEACVDNTDLKFWERQTVKKLAQQEQ